MTASKTTKKAVAKNTSKAATKAPKKKAPAKKTTAKKTPAKAVQEKEMTKALAIVPEPKPEPKPEPVPVETEVVTEPVPVEKPKKEKKAKKAKELIKVHHELGPSRGGKIQKRLKGNSTGKNAFGHKLRSQAAHIDELVALGRYTIPQIRILSGARTKGRIYNHFRALKEKGFPIINEDGKIKFA